MKINLKATGIELTPAISAYAEKRLQAVEKYLPNHDSTMQIEVGKVTAHHRQGDVFRAEVRISGAGTDYYAVREDNDLYAAIDLVKDEIVSEIRKTKGRKRELLRRGQKRVKEIMKDFPWLKRSQ